MAVKILNVWNTKFFCFTEAEASAITRLLENQCLHGLHLNMLLNKSVKC